MTKSLYCDCVKHYQWMCQHDKLPTASFQKEVPTYLTHICRYLKHNLLFSCRSAVLNMALPTSGISITTYSIATLLKVCQMLAFTNDSCNDGLSWVTTVAYHKVTSWHRKSCHILYLLGYAIPFMVYYIFTVLKFLEICNNCGSESMTVLWQFVLLNLVTIRM